MEHVLSPDQASMTDSGSFQGSFHVSDSNDLLRRLVSYMLFNCKCARLGCMIHLCVCSLCVCAHKLTCQHFTT